MDGSGNFVPDPAILAQSPEAEQMRRQVAQQSADGQPTDDLDDVGDIVDAVVDGDVVVGMDLAGAVLQGAGTLLGGLIEGGGHVLGAAGTVAGAVVEGAGPVLEAAGAAAGAVMEGAGPVLEAAGEAAGAVAEGAVEIVGGLLNN